MKKVQSNNDRDRIVENELRRYMDGISIDEFPQRNRDIVRSYVGGTSYSVIAKKHGFSSSRISEIVNKYIRPCSKLTGLIYNSIWDVNNGHAQDMAEIPYWRCNDEMKKTGYSNIKWSDKRRDWIYYNRGIAQGDSKL